MPALMATIGADARPMEKELARSSAAATAWSRGVRGAMDSALGASARRQSATLFNKSEIVSQAQQYSDFWQKALLDRDIETASRSNRARQLLRQRAEARAGGNGHKITWASGMGELAVIGRELMSGNWSRIPTSISVMIQRFNLLKFALHPITLSLAAIAGSFYIFHRRVKSLMEDLNTTVERVFRFDHIAKYLQKTSEIAQSQKNITDEVRRQVDAYNSVNEAADRLAETTKAQFEFERQKMALQKENELSRAKNVRQQRAIELKYADMGLSLNKRERDQEVEDMKRRKAALQEESKAKFAEADKILKTSGIQSDSKEKEHADNLETANVKAKDYFKTLEAGEEDNRPSSADKDRKIIADLTRKKEQGSYTHPLSTFAENTDANLFNSTDQARLDAAKSRMEKHRQSMKDSNAYLDAGGQRTRDRQRLEDIKKQGEKAAEDAQALGDERGGPIADRIRQNKAKDKRERELAELQFQKLNPPNVSHGSVNALQQVGAYAAPAVSIASKQLIHLRSIDSKIGRLGGGGSQGGGATKF